MRRAEMSGGDWKDGAGYKPGGTENDDGDVTMESPRV